MLYVYIIGEEVERGGGGEGRRRMMLSETRGMLERREGTRGSGVLGEIKGRRTHRGV
jgi:hypothetical protein